MAKPSNVILITRSRDVRRVRDSLRPPALDPKAYHGFIGTYIRFVAPDTEADPVGILLSVLARFSAYIGRVPCVFIGPDRHALLLYVILVGLTSSGRKGTADLVGRLLFPAGSLPPTLGGLGSGEHLVRVLKDRDPKEEALDALGAYAWALEHKRLLLRESELARILAVMERKGDILGTLLRQGWDGEPLEHRTNTSGTILAHHTHAPMLGMITQPELRDMSSETQQHNGVLNRCLFGLVERRELKAHPKTYTPKELTPHRQAMGDVLTWLTLQLRRAKLAWHDDLPLSWSPEAHAYWIPLYDELEAELPGRSGALVQRASPYVLRLAGLYALLDKSLTLQVAHLEAAHALWRYCRASALYVFGNPLDQQANAFLAALREAEPRGLTRDALRKAFPSLKQAQREATLLTLQQQGLARFVKVQTKGAPRVTWYAVDPESDKA